MSTVWIIFTPGTHPGWSGDELTHHFAMAEVSVLASWVGALNLLKDTRLRQWPCATSSPQMWGVQAASREKIFTEYLSARCVLSEGDIPGNPNCQGPTHGTPMFTHMLPHI